MTPIKCEFRLLTGSPPLFSSILIISIEKYHVFPQKKNASMLVNDFQRNADSGIYHTYLINEFVCFFFFFLLIVKHLHTNEIEKILWLKKRRVEIWSDIKIILKDNVWSMIEIRIYAKRNHNEAINLYPSYSAGKIHKRSILYFETPLFRNRFLYT